jgi:hypothetical protein
MTANATTKNAELNRLLARLDKARQDLLAAES